MRAFRPIKVVREELYMILRPPVPTEVRALRLMLVKAVLLYIPIEPTDVRLLRLIVVRVAMSLQ